MLVLRPRMIFTGVCDPERCGVRPRETPRTMFLKISAPSPWRPPPPYTACAGLRGRDILCDGERLEFSLDRRIGTPISSTRSISVVSSHDEGE